MLEIQTRDFDPTDRWRREQHPNDPPPPDALPAHWTLIGEKLETRNRKSHYTSISETPGMWVTGRGEGKGAE